MDEARIRNLAELRGVLAAAPEFSHLSRGGFRAPRTG